MGSGTHDRSERQEARNKTSRLLLLGSCLLFDFVQSHFGDGVFLGGILDFLFLENVVQVGDPDDRTSGQLQEVVRVQDQGGLVLFAAGDDPLLIGVQGIDVFASDVQVVLVLRQQLLRIVASAAGEVIGLVGGVLLDAVESEDAESAVFVFQLHFLIVDRALDGGHLLAAEVGVDEGE